MNTLMIGNFGIRRDAEGRYSLNDLHQAAGSEDRHKPSNWLRSDPAAGLEQVLISRYGEIRPIESSAGRYGGTFAVRELVYAYAMWVSPVFHLKVIDAYQSLVTGDHQLNRPVPETEDVCRAATELRAAKITFVAIFQAMRTIGAHHGRAIRSANACALRRTGIDMVSEMDIADMTGPKALPTTADDSLSLFMFHLQERQLGIEPRACLSSDLYELYQAWCMRENLRAYPIPQAIARLSRELRIPRKRSRWIDANGEVNGPHNIIFVDGDMPFGVSNPTAWIGEQVVAFKHDLRSWCSAAVKAA